MAIFRGTGGAGSANDDVTVTTVTTKASEAAASASAASSSASSAATSATSATNSASTATTKASEASTSKDTATTKASEASASATAAANSATAAAASAADIGQDLGTSDSPTFAGLTVNGAIVATSTVDGRDLQTDGSKLDGIEASATADQTNAEIRTAVEAASDSNVFTDADHSKLNAIEASATADQTNAEIRAAVEAATDSNVFTDTDHTKLNGIEASATADQSNDEIKAAVEAASDSNTFTDADHSKLNAIEASADVTDTANVTAAGALMDSEVTNLADVKAFDTADYATSAQGTLATNALPKSGGAMTGAITTNSTFDGRDVATDGSKLDGITALRPNLKPIIINGDMQISTRGTSFTANTAEIYTLDRFKYIPIDSPTNVYAITQDASVPSGQGFAKSLKVDVTTADTALDSLDGTLIEQRIEARNLQFLGFGASTARTMTLSFWVKSNKTGTYVVRLLQPDNSSKQVSYAYTISSSNTWEKKVVNIPADTNGVINNDSGAGLHISWLLSAGAGLQSGALRSAWTAYANGDVAPGQVNLSDNTSNEWLLTGVQLEVGTFTSATLPYFQSETVQDSQMRCARYFQKMTAANNNFVGRGFSSDGSGRGATLIDTPCAMRAGPTVTTSAASTFKFAIGTTGSGNGTSFIVKGYFTQAGMNNGQGLDSNQNFVVWLDIAASGLSNGAFTRGVSNGDSFVELSSEL